MPLLQYRHYRGCRSSAIPFCWKSMHHHLPLLISFHAQQGCSYIVSIIGTHYAKNPPIQDAYNIQANPGTIYHGLPVPEQSCRKQKPGNYWYECECNPQYISDYTNMHIYRGHNGMNTHEYTHIQKLRSYIIQSWPRKKEV